MVCLLETGEVHLAASGSTKPARQRRPTAAEPVAISERSSFGLSFHWEKEDMNNMIG